MQISELAKRCGVSTHALRHYERLGLLRPLRQANGYRDYSDAMRREVVFIAMSRKVGISLTAIAEQLPAYRAGRLALEFHLKMTRGEIGSFLGMTLETVSRTFAELQQQRLVKVEKRHIVIADLDGLSRV
jgi:DNA-binding transcriptional MerR regulator